MKRLPQAIGLAICAVIFQKALWRLLRDGMIYLGMANVDGPNPDRPGSLMGISASLLELVVEAALLVGSLAAAIMLLRGLRKKATPIA